MTLEQFTEKINTAVFISGNGSNMERIIFESQNGILNGLADIKLVFSDNKGAKGLKTAQNMGVKTIYLKQHYKNRKQGEIPLVKELKNNKIDLIVLAGYMRILSPYFVNEYKNRIINIHPADTEKYKGKNGYLWTYKNKLNYGVITIHLVNEKVDSGKILNKETYIIPKNSTLERIKKIGLKKEHEIYSKTIKQYIIKELL